MKLRRLLSVLVVAVCLGGPVIEMFDHWDNTLQDGHDTEADGVLVVLCIGLAVSFAGILTALVRSLSLGVRIVAAVTDANRFVRSLLPPTIPTSSPPTPLRI